MRRPDRILTFGPATLVLAASRLTSHSTLSSRSDLIDNQGLFKHLRWLARLAGLDFLSTEIKTT